MIKTTIVQRQSIPAMGHMKGTTPKVGWAKVVDDALSIYSRGETGLCISGHLPVGMAPEKFRTRMHIAARSKLANLGYKLVMKLRGRKFFVWIE